jgi:dihydrofolate reductase
MSWVFRHVGDIPGTVVDEVIARTGAVLAGRRVYEVGRRVQRPEARGLFDGRWSGPHFILTHTPSADETHPSFSFLSGDVGDAVVTAMTAAHGRDVLVLGANVVNQCSRLGSSMSPHARRAGASG